jgi:two-component system LytT family response regulator
MDGKTRGVRLRTLIVDDEPPARERIRSLLERRREIEIVGEAGSGGAAVAAIESLAPDLVFLDVQMPELDGFDVLAALPRRIPAIVFVTAYDEFALRAFEVNAVDYLLKPIQEQRFTEAVDRVLERARAPDAERDQTRLRSLASDVQARRPLRRFVVRQHSKVWFVRADDVDWIDADGNYLRLHIAGRVHLVRGAMRWAESELDPEQFYRIHRSAIVNIDRIASMEPHARGEYLVIMRDGARLVTSRAHRDRLKALLR